MDNMHPAIRTGDYVRFDHGSGKAHGRVEHINTKPEDVNVNGHTLKGSEDGDHTVLLQHHIAREDGKMEPRDTRMCRRMSQLEKVTPLAAWCSNSKGVERRVVPMPVTLTKRDNVDGDGNLDQTLPTINGYASVFHSDADPDGTTYQLGDGYFERILSTAFDRALREKQDVRALLNHNPDKVLGRTTNGTLRLSVDTKGLKYEADPPQTQDGRDTVTLLQRGDITGSSFGFIPRKVSHTEENGVVYRDIHDADLLDVSPVTYPAYTGSTSGVRSVDPKDAEAALKELAEFRASQAAENERKTAADEQRAKDEAEAARIEAERIAQEQRDAEAKRHAELRKAWSPIEDRVIEVQERAISPSEFKATPYADLEVSQESFEGSKSEIANGVLTEDPDNDQWEDMKRCYLVYAPGGDRGDPPQQIGAYKFPIAARVGGKLVAHANQVHAAVAALNGARTPSNIPTEAKKAAFANALKYLRKLGVKDEDLPKFKG